jgi:REP element-mobilizing transposase RayT
MARRPRPQIENGIYHVVSRGVRRTPIFHDEDDREQFLRLLAFVLRTYEWRCFAYCLMTNHFHLAVQTIEPTISRGMQYLNGRYCQQFTVRYGLPGHVLERRFFSEVVEREAYGLSLVRYIVRNPVRAGICGSPEHWPWSSFAATVGLVSAPELLDVEWTLEQFSDDPRSAARQFAEFVADGDDSGPDWGLTPGVGDRAMAGAR